MGSALPLVARRDAVSDVLRAAFPKLEGRGYVDGQPPSPRTIPACKHHPDCFTCPFSDCLAGSSSAYYAHMAEVREARRGRVLAMHAQGKAAEEIAATEEISRRSVWRILAEALGPECLTPASPLSPLHPDGTERGTLEGRPKDRVESCG